MEGFAPRLVPQASGTSALLQAVGVVDERTVWVSGHQGTWARTLDGGVTWGTGRVPGADTLQVRDVHAASADTAWLMSAGTGPLSRIFRTTDGGATWRQQHVAEESEAFYDCMDFWDSRTGIVFGDATGGRLSLLATADGERWVQVPADRLPSALAGEGSFAASGRCIAVAGTGHAWIGMGNSAETRVLMTRDRGRSWEVVRTPIVSGEGNGLTTVAFRDTLHGVALGGTIGAPDAYSDNVAVTADGGRTWTLGARPPFPGAIYGGTYVPRSRAVVAVGPRGTVWSADDARSWAPLDTLAYWSIGFASPDVGWAVGPRGRITRIEMR
ncbi:MAG TPA: hypothetical protein VMM18_13140 [Gemmatimonadaceae bacterium]|nr:hypothetical protein [Gemmatimonadaceae bacterium]